MYILKTIKQIADELGVSKGAIQKRLVRPPLCDSIAPHITIKQNTKYIDDEGEKLIKAAFDIVDANIDTGVDKSIDGDDKPIDKPSQVDALISMLQKELEIKNKQIEELNLRLAESNSALVSAQQMVQAEQTLHAGSIQSRLLTDGKENGGLWSKIFKKKGRYKNGMG